MYAYLIHNFKLVAETMSKRIEGNKKERIKITGGSKDYYIGHRGGENSEIWI